MKRHSPLQACPWVSADECGIARERSVAGISNTLPMCSKHTPACPSCGEIALAPLGAADMECQACGAIEAADEPGDFLCEPTHHVPVILTYYPHSGQGFLYCECGADPALVLFGAEFMARHYAEDAGIAFSVPSSREEA